MDSNDAYGVSTGQQMKNVYEFDAGIEVSTFNPPLPPRPSVPLSSRNISPYVEMDPANACSGSKDEGDNDDDDGYYEKIEDAVTHVTAYNPLYIKVNDNK